MHNGSVVAVDVTGLCPWRAAVHGHYILSMSFISLPTKKKKSRRIQNRLPALEKVNAT